MAETAPVEVALPNLQGGVFFSRMFWRPMRIRFLLAATVAVAACGDSPTDPNPPIITLSAQQAATLVGYAEALADVHPDLEWLADSIELVVRGGAQAKRIVVSENGEPVNLYAVSLQRDVRTSTTSFATWHLFAFDNASSPSAFIVASGFAQGSGTTPPTSTFGAFGGQSVHAHVITVDGNLTDPRRAISGGATFAVESVGGACPGGAPPAGTTCNNAEMEVGFDIVVVTPPYQPERTYHLLAVAVPGVMLRIEQ